MSLTEREEQIAIEIFNGEESDFVKMIDIFISRIREEQEAVAWLVPDGTEWFPSKRALINNSIPLFTIPPAAPDCKELVEALEGMRQSYVSALRILGTEQPENDIAVINVDEALAKHKASMGEK